MTPAQLKSRQVFIKASKLKSRASMKSFSRRDENQIDSTKDSHPNEKFDTFFDFEQELSELKPSSQQYDQMDRKTIMEVEPEETDGNSYTGNKYITLEEKSIDNYSIMEEVISPVAVEVTTIKKDNSDDKVSDSRCCYVRKDGGRCKKAHIKESTFCKVHKKIMDKQ